MISAVRSWWRGLPSVPRYLAVLAVSLALGAMLWSTSYLEGRAVKAVMFSGVVWVSVWVALDRRFRETRHSRAAFIVQACGALGALVTIWIPDGINQRMGTDLYIVFLTASMAADMLRKSVND